MSTLIMLLRFSFEQWIASVLLYSGYIGNTPNSNVYPKRELILSPVSIAEDYDKTKTFGSLFLKNNIMINMDILTID